MVRKSQLRKDEPSLIQEVLKLRFGNQEPSRARICIRSMSTIARILGVTENRVRYLLAKGKLQLQEPGRQPK